MKNILVILLLSMFSCMSKYEKKQDSNLLEKNDSVQPAETLPLFKIKALEDTLTFFFNSVDSIPNPFGAPKINLVTIEKTKKDIFITLVAYIGLYEIIHSKDTFFLKGGCQLNGEEVAVYYSGVTHLENIINENLLSLEHIDKMNIPSYYEKSSYIWDYRPFTWKYKLVGDSLIIVEKYSRNDF